MEGLDGSGSHCGLEEGGRGREPRDAAASGAQTVRGAASPPAPLMEPVAPARTMTIVSLHFVACTLVGICSSSRRKEPRL